MNYRHNYHAGNFADVFKHIVLVTLLKTLQKKEKGYLYLDTHAGLGLYDLEGKIAQKTQEYKNGIEKIYTEPTCPLAIKNYLKIIRSINEEKALHYYPGSPLIAKILSRPQDKIIAIEKHQEDVKILKQNFACDQQVAVHHADGYQSLKAFLPPACGRGLIFIDPPFEEKDEFEKIVAGLKIGIGRFPGGIYSVWFPIKPDYDLKKFLYELSNIKAKNILMLKFSLSRIESQEQFLSCGMVVINAPWKFEEEFREIGMWLKNKLEIDSTGDFIISAV